MGAWLYIPSCPSWRWVDWTTLILIGLVLTISIFLLPETHPAIIQSWKARHLRKITNEPRYLARVEIIKLSFWVRMKKALYRPIILAKEPIVIAITIYLTIIWAILFTFLDGYGVIFQETYQISQGITNTIFVAMYLGVPCAIPPLTVVVYWATMREMKRQRDAGVENPTLRPETRLWWAMYGGAWAIPVSLNWLAWTTYVRFPPHPFRVNPFLPPQPLKMQANIHPSTLAQHLHLGPHNVHPLLRLRIHLHLHLHIPLYHRRIRSQRRQRPDLLHRHPVSCVWRARGGWCPVLWERGTALDGLYLRLF